MGSVTDLHVAGIKDRNADIDQAISPEVREHLLVVSAPQEEADRPAGIKRDHRLDDRADNGNPRQDPDDQVDQQHACLHEDDQQPLRAAQGDLGPI